MNERVTAKLTEGYQFGTVVTSLPRHGRYRVVEAYPLRPPAGSALVLGNCPSSFVGVLRAGDEFNYRPGDWSDDLCIRNCIVERIGECTAGPDVVRRLDDPGPEGYVMRLKEHGHYAVESTLTGGALVVVTDIIQVVRSLVGGDEFDYRPGEFSNNLAIRNCTVRRLGASRPAPVKRTSTKRPRVNGGR